VRLTINLGSEYGDTLSATFSRGPSFLTSLQLASGCSHRMGGSYLTKRTIRIKEKEEKKKRRANRRVEKKGD